MLGLVWFLVAAEVLGASPDLSTWETHLKAIDPSLPTTTANGLKICYYFDLAPTCAGNAIGALLNQAPVSNVLAWSPTVADCSKLLDKQRPALARVASDLFGATITSAATAGVTNFDLLTQSWVLRVGHHVLSVKQAAFVAAINSVSDWKTVHCDGANLVYDGKTIAKPDFVGPVDCDILDTVYADVCANGSCTLTQATTCCVSNKASECCKAKLTTIQSECGSNNSCAYKSTCCSLDASTSCCTGIVSYACTNQNCDWIEAPICCASNKASECCKPKLAFIQNQCVTNMTCAYQSTCCSLDSTSTCCTRQPRDPCPNGACTSAEARTCCASSKTGACCQAHLSTVQSECSSISNCGFKAACCNLNLTYNCCTWVDPCANGSCTLAVGITCCGSYQNSGCCQTHLAAIYNECKSNISCSHKDTCCSLDASSQCCTGIVNDLCTNPRCITEDSLACCITDEPSPCCQLYVETMREMCSTDNSCGIKNTCCALDLAYTCCVNG